jgi:hypothetical protein
LGLAGVSTSHEDGNNTVALTGLREPIRSGLTYPVVFGFERAGDLLLEVPVDTPDVPTDEQDAVSHRHRLLPCVLLPTAGTRRRPSWARVGLLRRR